MQQHPVPQNIINFQFKLVGDMTLKQFGYLAGGIVLGIVASKLPYPAIFNYTLAGAFAFSGFALAFLPIQDRPLDIWVKNFVISIFSPTQFVYQKTGGNLDFLNIDLSRESQNAAIVIEKNLKKDRYRDFLGTLTPVKKNPIDLAVNQYLKSLDLSGNTAPQNHHSKQVHVPERSLPDFNLEGVKVRPLIVKEAPKKPSSPLVEEKEEKKEIPVMKKTPLSNQFQSISLNQKPQESTVFVKNSYVAPKQDIGQTNKGFDYLKNRVYAENNQNEKEKAEEEAKQKELIKQKLEEIKNKQMVDKNSPQEQNFTKPQTVDVSNIKRIYQTPQTPKTANVISGTVTDMNNVPISGTIIEIKNSSGMAVRTLRTNTIGQFTIITPLTNGEYEIFVEKQGLAFDIIKIILDNKIVEPILIKAKQN